MFKNNKRCSECGNTYDALEKECPSCHLPNVDAIKRNDKHVILNGKNQLLFFMLGYFGLLIITTIITVFMQLVLSLDSQAMLSTQTLGFITFLSYGLLFCTFLFFVIKNNKAYRLLNIDFKEIVFGIFLGVVLLALSSGYDSFSTLIVETEINSNQASVIEITKIYPIFSIIFLGIIGPICEELTYRVGLFTFLTRFNRLVAYFAGTLIFALIHFDPSCFIEAIGYGSVLPIVRELVALPSYLIGGFMLNFTYDRYGLKASILAHMLNNIVSIVGCILVYS